MLPVFVDNLPGNATVSKSIHVSSRTQCAQVRVIIVVITVLLIPQLIHNLTIIFFDDGVSRPINVVNKQTIAFVTHTLDNKLLQNTRISVLQILILA